MKYESKYREPYPRLGGQAQLMAFLVCLVVAAGGKGLNRCVI